MQVSQPNERGINNINGMEFSAEKTKLMTNNTRGISSDIRIGGQNLETVQSFKYLGSVTTDEGSKQEILSRIAQAVVHYQTQDHVESQAHCPHLQNQNDESLALSIFLSTSKTWTLTAELRKDKSTELRRFRKLLGISYREHVTNEKSEKHYQA